MNAPAQAGAFLFGQASGSCGFGGKLCELILQSPGNWSIIAASSVKHGAHFAHAV